MNSYLKNLEKIEFVITNSCTGKCKHCSEGNHLSNGISIDVEAAVNALKAVTEIYKIKTVMTFGGEPLLHPETVAAIHCVARDRGVEKRQVITNGFFSKDSNCIHKVARMLFAAGVNDLLLSVDCFHQEFIPSDTVKLFAEEALSVGLPIRTQPAWLVSKEDDNPFNLKTKEILSEFKKIGIEENKGNVIFPQGNALVYFKEYFADNIPENPYIEDPENIRCISFDPQGNVLDESIYKKDIKEILNNYKPKLR
ncbi:MAG: radical SAM protein [Clostridia bacterium]|nr:radical SAM protein [Clostridia bacterium]